ncbi:DUF6350 family protein [Saccharomonospora sp. NPDC006951]
MSRGVRCRALAAAALSPLVAGYAVVAAVFAVVTAAASQAEFSPLGVVLGAGPGWLAAYQVPLDIGGAPLGVLPLLPTVGVCLLIARTAASTAQRLRCTEPGQSGFIIGVIAAAHALAGIAISVLAGGELGVEPLAAFLVPALVSAAAAALGVAGRCGFVAAARNHLDPVALRGMRAGALGLAALLCAGAVTFLFATALSVPTVRSLFAANAEGAGSGAGMLLLCLGYLPNAMVLSLGFVTGPGFSIGSVTVAPFTFSGGPVPGVPLLAGLPEQQAAWWPVLLVLPAAAGALVGWSLRKSHDNPMVRLRTVGVAGALVGFGTVVIGTLAGGRLGSGALDPVSVPLGMLSIVAFLWIAVPGGFVAWFAGPRAVKPVATDAAAAPTGTGVAVADDAGDQADDDHDGQDPEDPEDPNPGDIDDTDEATEVEAEADEDVADEDEDVADEEDADIAERLVAGDVTVVEELPDVPAAADIATDTAAEEDPAGTRDDDGDHRD